MTETDIGQYFHMIIDQTVVQHRPFSPVFDKIDVAQKSQLMTHRRLGDLEEGGKVADTHFEAFQSKQNPQAAWVRKYLEHL
jgi:hypothetical protein